MKIVNMYQSKHIYTFSYEHSESDLCKLESRYIFGHEECNKLLFSDRIIEPSSSAFIKQRVDVIVYSPDYSSLLANIKNEIIVADDFKVEYIVIDGDDTEYKERLHKLKEIGYSIEGEPDYYNPLITYVLCKIDQFWCFGELIKDKYDWQKHKQKPKSYSNSLGVHIAKSLVNIATKSDVNVRVLDACCGVGTIMLEACFVGYTIEGCEINWKICNDARENLAYFNYSADVHLSDVKDLQRTFDVAIVDLPYNLFTKATDNEVKHIIEATSKITNKMVVVSTVDISTLLNSVGFRIMDKCEVGKSGKRKFSRKVWVCEKLNI